MGTLESIDNKLHGHFKMNYEKVIIDQSLINKKATRIDDLIHQMT